MLLVAAVVVARGEAFGGGWPAAPQALYPGTPYSAGCASCVEDSPLRPEMIHWSLQHSQCKQTRGFPLHKKPCETQVFPPLPYSFGAHTMTELPPAGGFPAPAAPR